MQLTTGGQATQRVVWKGWLEIDDKRMYLKSKWEKRYCLYLSFMKKYGHIKDYWYEPETFWFDGIKRGTNNYKPDFKVEFPSGNVEYYEIKGYETAKDRTKYKRMEKYHPTIKLNIIGKKWYADNGKTLRKIIKDW